MEALPSLPKDCAGAKLLDQQSTLKPKHQKRIFLNNSQVRCQALKLAQHIMFGHTLRMIYGNGYGNEIMFKTQMSGTVTDIEGNIYKTITIGDQIG